MGSTAMRFQALAISLVLPLVAQTLAACSDNRTPFGPDGGPPPTSDCLPDLDDQLTRAEMPTFLGTVVSYLVAQNTTVDTSGSDLDLSAQVAGERKYALEASALGEQWFAAEFPASSIVVPLDFEGQAVGILQSSDEAIRLVGIASTQEDYTLLHYQTPIDLYRFPLTVGQSFVTESAVVGQFEAVPYNGSDRYAVEVTSIDSVALPHLRFTHSFRVHTEVTSDSGAAGLVIKRQQLSLVSECFGEIARVVSQDDESEANFSDAAELWRFSL